MQQSSQNQQQLASPEEQWAERVRTRQMQRMTPEQQQAAKEKAAKLRRRQHEQRSLHPSQLDGLQRRCDRIATTNRMSRAAFVGGMKNAYGTPQPALGFGSAPAPAPALAAPTFGGFGSCAASVQQSVAAFGAVQHANAAFTSSAATSAASPGYINDQAFHQQVAQTATIGGFNLTDADVGDDEFQELLNQLALEPDNDEERQGKFQLYEKYAETLTQTREAALSFWSDAKSEFLRQGATSARDETEQRFKRLDRHECMALHFTDHNRRWFVYDMTTTAHKNSQAVEGLLKEIKRKLNLLEEQDVDSACECPVCFETIGTATDTATATATATDTATDTAGSDGAADCATSAAKPATTLSCCHKLCTECWENWTRLNPGRAFCPLCRQEDFVQAIVSGPRPNANANGAGGFTFGGGFAPSPPTSPQVGFSFGAPAFAPASGAPAPAFGAPAPAFGAPAPAFGARRTPANPFGSGGTSAPAAAFSFGASSAPLTPPSQGGFTFGGPAAVLPPGLEW